MDDNAVFKSLRSDLANTAETDAIVRGLDRFAATIDQVLEGSGVQLQSTVEQIKQELHAARYRGSTFRTLFSGMGPVAQRLAEHAAINELLFGKTTPAKLERVTALLARLNYQVTDDAAQLHEIHRFCQDLFALLQPEALRVTPFEPLPERLTPGTAKTGLYYQTLEDSSKAYGCVLAGQIEGTQVRVAAFAGTHTPVQIFVHHPQECLWVPFDGTVTIPGLIEVLEKELASARQELENTRTGRDWTAEFEQVKAKAHEVFGRSQVLPMHLHGFTRVSSNHREINVQEEHYRVMFNQTDGKWASESTVILTDRAECFSFAVAFAELPAEHQCRLVSRLSVELDRLLGVIEKAEELQRRAELSP